MSGSRNGLFPRLAALALLVAPGFALADAGQAGHKCTHSCAAKSEAKAAKQIPSSTSSEELQRIWTAA